MRFLLAIALFALALPSSAASLYYTISGDLSAFSGSGFVGLSLSSFGSPTENVIATVSDLTFNGGTYDFGTGDPVTDVLRSGNNIVFGGTSLSRTYDIPVPAFGTGFTLQLILSGSGVLGTGSGDGWTFALFASDLLGNLESLTIDIPPSGNPVIDKTAAITISDVPEPATTYPLLAIAVGMLGYRLRRQR